MRCRLRCRLRRPPVAPAARGKVRARDALRVAVRRAAAPAAAAALAPPARGAVVGGAGVGDVLVVAWGARLRRGVGRGLLLGLALAAQLLGRALLDLLGVAALYVGGCVADGGLGVFGFVGHGVIYVI